MAKLDRRRVIGAQAMISLVRLERGCMVPMHEHANEQFACVLSGRLRFTLGTPAGGVADGAKVVEVGAGEVMHLPGGVPHAAEAIETTEVLDVFSPPSEKTGIDQISKR